MTKLCYHLNKKTGVRYVYSIEKSYWDKQKKSPRNKQVCLGKLDPESGKIIPSKRRQDALKQAEQACHKEPVKVSCRIAGPSLILDQITRKHKIDKLLKKCLKDDNKCKLILSLVYFIVQKGLALSRSEAWSETHLHPFEKPISSQKISILLKDISEDERQQFLSLWLRHVLEEDYLCYDITSISSYGKQNEYAHFGYNRDKDRLEQINLAMLFGQNSHLPAYYRRMPGNISDVATLKTTLKSLDFLGLSDIHVILDRGFYSVSNIDELFQRKQKFTISIPSGRKWIENILEKHKEKIAYPSNYLEFEGESLYAVTEPYKWGKNNHKSYLHIYYNSARAAAEFDRFTRRMMRYREEVLLGKRIKKHEEFYKRYLIIKETPKRGLKVTFNDTAIQQDRKRYSGFFCILSNKMKSAKKALEIYRTKDVVEKSFDDLKNHLDMKRIRVHTSQTMDTRLFLQFLALIYLSTIRETIKGDNKLKNYVAQEVMERMETLSKIKYSDRSGQIFTETTPTQKQILKIFEIQHP